MKINSIEVKDYPPIKNLKLENLGSVVIIAGANGSGKTRLKNAIGQTLQGQSLVSITLDATRDEESKVFNGTSIAVKQGENNTTLTQYIHNRRFGGRARYVGSLVQIDSSRNIQTINYQSVNWFGSDPDEQETSPNWGYQDFRNRWQEFMNYIHQKSAARDKILADELKKHPSNGELIVENNPDPLNKYKEIFSQLLPGKELQDINPGSPREFQYKDIDGSILPFSSLSSGEQEVIKVIFDIARKDIRHSIIIVDEPELHLHPTLTFKLIETLKAIGDHTNQFIFLTHSADLISTYYSTGNVFFIDTVQSGSNQAHRLSDLNHTHKELVNLIGENLGLFAVGKKLIFVEGETSSIDRLSYHLIAQKYLPDAKIIPVGSVDNLGTLNSIDEQIQNSIFGISFYMIRDRDGLSNDQIQELENKGKIKCLKKRHIENYFLNPEILFKVALKLYLPSVNPTLTEAFIESELKRIASESLKQTLLQNIKDYLSVNHSFQIPTIRSVESKSLESIKQEMINNVQDSLNNLASTLSSTNLESFINIEIASLQEALVDGTWVDKFHGKIIFSKLCSDVLRDNPLKIRQAYIETALEEKPEVFSDIITIYQSFMG